ncbi:pyruvate formate-lyase-activating enzyme [Paraliobacillus quinghaiensis]|uniref:Pyruvate formate-lyase-activating enzyme n=1 Tax=Paraliobacillus quinghaiensis TaxID=470815 RepID=A0A917TQR2_9BACI|nr:pyruvate formate-lyase-activating protein [Paraliobacillus quinghaiensis]GGM33641.1 pyruvate formate-lyase-activating enzyme [Paraliobacillus quinghaiensis]
MKGRIHSIETMGTVDGPGLRYVIFTQGCLLRCKFCHNPDTWKMGQGKEMTVEQMVKDIKDYLPFFQSTNGGVTVSGGEPLLQVEFLIELFTELKKLGVHTTIDSSAGCFSRSPRFMKNFDRLLEVTDLVLLDLKHIDPVEHKELTGMSNEHIIDMAKYLDEKSIPIWVRHVLIPGISDKDEYLQRLSDFIATLGNVEQIDVLPYHKLGVYKWENLGLKYPLEGVEPPTEDRVKNAEDILNRVKVVS